MVKFLPTVSRYDTFLVSNPRDEMSKFVIDVPDLGKEGCSTAMLLNDMNFYRLKLYAQSIEELKGNSEGSNSFQGFKPTSSTFGIDTTTFFGCGKDFIKVRYCPNVGAKERENKEVPQSVAEGGFPKRNHFYAL
ncbi:hypothetical protein EJD97_000577 [Solanum chilense]|uniref:Uncharacterized protein n=1 Tax=Solanum chilense TaxID=4083 RepID=A0A6N2C4H4_SOLCI|nr:hypothetical protein EJD97_000577 [Solanum chilense]